MTNVCQATTPHDALRAALIEAGASEEDASVSKATRRAILRLI